MNRTERALKKQARRRMAKSRDEKNCLILRKEGVFSSYHSLMSESDRSKQIKELDERIKSERREKHSIYSNFVDTNKKLNSYAEKSAKEEVGA